MTRSKSKLGTIAFIAAITLATPAFAANYAPDATGGGSAGYNAHNETNYRLKPHHGSPHARDNHTIKNK